MRVFTSLEDDLFRKSANLELKYALLGECECFVLRTVELANIGGENLSTVVIAELESLLIAEDRNRAWVRLKKAEPTAAAFLNAVSLEEHATLEVLHPPAEQQEIYA